MIYKKAHTDVQMADKRFLGVCVTIFLSYLFYNIFFTLFEAVCHYLSLRGYP